MNYQQYNVLMHHGIKGQRWGVENGPPYPLDKEESRRIKAEARLKKQKDKAEERDEIRRIKSEAKIKKTMQKHQALTDEDASRLKQLKKAKRKEVATTVLKTTASAAIELGALYAGVKWLSGPVGAQMLGDIAGSIATAIYRPKIPTVNSVLDTIGTTALDASAVNSVLDKIGTTTLDVLTRGFR